MAWRGAVARNLKGMMKQEGTSIRERFLPKGKASGDYVPVYMSLGLISLQLVIGVHIIKQQLMHNPGVSVNKNRRETVPEVEDPDLVANESENFMKKSFFRKVAHIQEFETPLDDPMHGNPLAKEPRVESLKSVGVNPAPC